VQLHLKVFGLKNITLKKFSTQKCPPPQKCYKMPLTETVAVLSFGSLDSNGKLTPKHFIGKYFIQKCLQKCLTKCPSIAAVDALALRFQKKAPYFMDPQYNFI